MKQRYLYDAAISYVGYDALTARRLADRLQPRLSLPVFAGWEHRDDIGSDGESAAEKAIGSQARVVIVLHQRLWGETPSTRVERGAIERRLAARGTGFLVVVPLEPSGNAPEWLPESAKVAIPPRAGVDEIVQAIAEAIEREGGATRQATEVELAGRAERDHKDVQDRATVLRSAKAHSAAARELTALIGEIEEQVAALRTARPGLTLTVRRLPDRCLVQAGPVGLSVSWLRSRANTVADGTLLVIEWNGTMAVPGERPVASGATVAREHALHFDAAGAAWRWRCDDAAMREYTSADLAAQCVQLLERRLDAASV